MPSQATTSDITTLTYWQPGAEEYDLVYRAAQTFALNCDPTAGQKHFAAFVDLIDALFFRFFMTMQSCPPSLPQPLLDCLLCCCESPTLENAQREHYPALNFLTSRLLVAFADVVGAENTVEQVDDAEHLRSFVVLFFYALRELWNMHKSKRLKQTFWTPMPWSRSSRMAEYKSRAHLDNPPCVTIDDITNSARDDLFYFPDILWLGGRHDGYCRATTLSAYVWIRLRTARSATEHLALWQAALSFGILEALSGLRITESVLVTRRADGVLVLTSAKVSQFIWFWLFGRAVVREPSEIRQWVELARREISGATLAINEQAMNRMSMIPGSGRLTEDEFQEILCSLAALTDVSNSLCSIVTSGSALEESLPSRNVVPRMAMPFTRYRKMMTMRGWCPSVCQLTEVSTSYTLAYAATLSPPLVEGCAVEHGTCSEASCQAYIVDSDDYETRHARTCSDPLTCRFLKPALTSISQLLSSGNIPVIVYDGQSLIVRNAADGPYVSISHVWADGLGSTTEQGLPECQVGHIASLSRQLVPDGAFWLDSLCVPGGDRHLRRSAIRLMANGYRNADKVLVFDAAIRQLSRSAMPLKEIILRIAMSSWMYRVWTLQEALLARELYFEFADMLVSLASLRAAYKHCREPVPSSLGPVNRDLFMSNHCEIPSLSRLLSDRSPSDAKYSFEDIVQMLNRRSTGKPEDETLAIARLLGIDVAELLAVEDADARMRIFFLNLKTVPAFIVWKHKPHATLPFPGFRWAPRTLTQLESASDDIAGIAECTPQGLITQRELPVISFPAMELGSSDAHPDHFLIKHSNNRNSYLVFGLRGSVPQDAVVTVNALVSLPGPLVLDGMLSHQAPDSDSDSAAPPLTMAVAVYLTDSDGSSSTEDLTGALVVCRCEPLFQAKMVEANSYMSSLGSIKESDLRVIEGDISSRRIMFT